MRKQIRSTQATLSRLAILGSMLVLTLTMVGCRANKDQSNVLTAPTVQVATAPPLEDPAVAQTLPTQQTLGSLVGSEKIMSDIRAAGFSVTDPNMHWGVTIVVDAEQTTGGFSADASEGIITLHWGKVPDASSYEIFRSTQPVVPLLMETMLTMDAGGNLPDVEYNHWLDNQVAAQTRYYYAVLAITKTGSSALVATGSAEIPASNQSRTNLNASNLNSDGESHATSKTALPQSGSVDPEAVERQAMRQKDGVTSLDMGQHASHAPKGTYAFTWSYYRSGDFLLDAEHEPDEYDHPFEIHKLSSGQYSLVGYVDADTAKKLREDNSGFQLTVYAHRWSGATEIVSLPLERLSPYAHAVRVTIEGRQHYVMKVDWK
jgi:hypothetical protein